VLDPTVALGEAINRTDVPRHQKHQPHVAVAQSSRAAASTPAHAAGGKHGALADAPGAAGHTGGAAASTAVVRKIQATPAELLAAVAAPQPQGVVPVLAPPPPAGNSRLARPWQQAPQPASSPAHQPSGCAPPPPLVNRERLATQQGKQVPLAAPSMAGNACGGEAPPAPSVGHERQWSRDKRGARICGTTVPNDEGCEAADPIKQQHATMGSFDGGRGQNASSLPADDVEEVASPGSSFADKAAAGMSGIGAGAVATEKAAGTEPNVGDAASPEPPADLVCPITGEVVGVWSFGILCKLRGMPCCSRVLLLIGVARTPAHPPCGTCLPAA
jgi:hypothetical protein